MEFPLFNTKELSDGSNYDLTNPLDRKIYFQAKLGTKIDEVKEYLDKNNTFVGFLMAKKQAGKGTYSKMMEEILGVERLAHISVGDVVREVHQAIEDPVEKSALEAYMHVHYRGLLSVDSALDALVTRSQDKVSVPTEFILTLLKRQIEKLGRKALFLDGLPRSLDQVSAALYFRDLINYRDDPDFFVLIDTPLAIIESRFHGRVVCPDCHLSRNLLYGPTRFVKFDSLSHQYYLLCDNSSCPGVGKTRLVAKEGDKDGIDAIRGRLEADGDLIRVASNLTGIPKVLVRSSLPISVASKYAEDYELQPRFSYNWDGKNIAVLREPWSFNDDSNVPSYSLMAAPVVVSLFSQIHKILLV